MSNTNKKKHKSKNKKHKSNKNIKSYKNTNPINNNSKINYINKNTTINHYYNTPNKSQITNIITSILNFLFAFFKIFNPVLELCFFIITFFY